MEEESQKVMGLKKVYAEMIMNTAKEAGARIMMSERKSHEYRRELSSTKDEAPRLLLRLKQTMDSKINEVEIKSQDQQIKIEVLEAQLQEAEDIVGNLRAELNEAHMKLDEFKNNQINIRTKEHELYRNGCTQRIRACDGNRLKGHFSMAGEVDHSTYVKEIRDGEEDEKECLKTPMVYDTLRTEEEKQIGIEVEDEENVDLMKYLKILRTSYKYKRNNVSLLKHVSHVQACLPDFHDMHESDNDEEGTPPNSPFAAPSDTSEMGALPNQAFSFQSDDKLSELKLLDTFDGLSSPQKERILKHTFQRRRKKESVAGETETGELLHEQNPSRKRIANKQIGYVEPVESGETTESSLDDQRMKPAACQIRQNQK